jgi:transcriptional regulator with XRE-family HTH domain
MKLGQVGREIRRLREAQGLSQTKVAAAADMGPSGLSQIETGARNPSAVTLHKIATALGVEVAELFPKGRTPQPDDGVRVVRGEARVQGSAAVRVSAEVRAAIVAVLRRRGLGEKDADAAAEEIVRAITRLAA